jgi:hypothetical protein
MTKEQHKQGRLNKMLLEQAIDPITLIANESADLNLVTQPNPQVILMPRASASCAASSNYPVDISKSRLILTLASGG